MQRGQALEQLDPSSYPRSATSFTGNFGYITSSLQASASLSVKYTFLFRQFWGLRQVMCLGLFSNLLGRNKGRKKRNYQAGLGKTQLSARKAKIIPSCQPHGPFPLKFPSPSSSQESHFSSPKSFGLERRGRCSGRVCIVPALSPSITWPTGTHLPQIKLWQASPTHLSAVASLFPSSLTL